MKLVVGDYLEVAGKFDGLCMVDSSLQRITETYPSVVNTVQQYFDKYGKRVFNCGVGKNIPRIIFFPHDDANIAKKSCRQITDIVEKMGFKQILIPKPWNYDSIQGILEGLDDRFVLISDDANDIPNMEIKKIEPPIQREEVKTLKNLECSSAGDKRFSAMYAVVEYMGIEDTIEHHYQASKRFIVENTYVALDSPKGKKVDACELFGTLYEPSILSMFYSWLWCKYFNEHKDLLEYASGFDTFTDKFKGKAINCQADVIYQICKKPSEVMELVSPIVELENIWLSSISQAPSELPYGVEETTPTESSNTFGVNDSTEVGFSFEDEVEDTIEYRPITLCVTGHRPKDLWGYEYSPKYAELQNKIFQCIEHFHSAYNVTRYISGGAQGADQLFFGVVDFFRKNYQSNIENLVYVPFRGQEVTWREKGSMFSQDDYNTMLSNATDIVLCDDSFAVTREMSRAERELKGKSVHKALKDRNDCMIRDTNYVIGIYKGDINLIGNDVNHKGGTLHCLRSAYKAGKGIVIINPETLETTRINM